MLCSALSHETLEAYDYELPDEDDDAETPDSS